MMEGLKASSVHAVPAVASPPAGAPGLALTFTVEPAALRAAERLPLFGEASRPRWRRVETTYFDTEAGDLRRSRVSLTMRRLRAGYAMGLSWPPGAKAGAVEGERGEIRLRSALPIPSRLPAEDSGRLEALVGEKPLEPWLVAQLRRSRRFAAWGAATIEVTIDAGFLAAKDRRAPVREIKINLLSGDASDFYRFAFAALDALPLQLAVGGALARGARLASDDPLACVGAVRSSIPPHETMEDAIRAVFGDCLSHFAGNWPIVGTSASTEAVHQMRVALRRLRAALAFFAREWPCPEFAAFRAEAKTIAAALAQARDWDVFIALVESGPANYFGKEPGFAPLLAAARRKAAAGHTIARDLVTSQAATRFVLSMAEFLARRGWRDGHDEASPAAFGGPVVDFAERTLDRLDRKMRRQGKHFDDLDAEARHELRIALKNVRYAADFFGHLFHPRGAMRRYSRRAAALQDLLGVLNDADVAAKMLRRLDAPNHPARSYAAGLIGGWCARGARGDDEASRAAWKQLSKAKRPWRASPPARPAPAAPAP